MTMALHADAPTRRMGRMGSPRSVLAPGDGVTTVGPTGVAMGGVSPGEGDREDAVETPAWLRATADGVEIRLKAVPGARRSQIAGVLGDRLKLRIAAPPADGQANRA